MKFSLPDIALRRPVTVIMLVVTCLGLGMISWYRLPVEFIPKLDVPFIGVFIPYPNATPAEVEKEIAIPAEGEFRTVSDLKRITTESNENGCFVRLRFEWESDLALASSEVRDRMERLKLKLPTDVDRMILQRYSSNTMPIMAFALYREGDEEELVHRVRTLLRPRLLRIEGVADVRVFGQEEREVVIEFDQDALRRHNLALYEVVSSLQTSSLNVTVGELTEGRTKYYVRALGEFTHPRQMAELVVGPNALRLKDVARVDYKVREENEKYFIDRQGGAFVLIMKESEANTVSTCNAVKAELDRAGQDPDFTGIRSLMFFDQSEIIRSAIDGLMESGKIGGMLAVIVLFLFLKRFLPTIVTALAIPSSLTIAFAYMYFVGMTLNIVTMASMIIGIGMLVDNAIVVIENIYRHGQLGLSPVERSRVGATEVALAVTASTATTVVVFLPMLYLQGGEMSIYMRQFAAPVTVAMLASLLMALTVIPLATAHMHRPRVLDRRGVRRFTSPRARRAARRRRHPRPGPLSRIRPFAGLLHVYHRSLHWVITRRPAAVLMVVATCAITYQVPYKNVGVQQMPTIDTREVEIQVELDQNFDMDMAAEMFATLQGVIDQRRKELGIKNVFTQYGPGGGALQLYLLQPEDLPEGATLPHTTDDVLDILWQTLPRHIPGVDLRFSVAEAGEGNTAGISLMMRGDDIETLNRYAQQFKQRLVTVPDLSDVETDTERAKREVRIRIDEGLAEEAGVSPLVVARTVDFALRGIRLPYIKREGREIPVWAQFREEDRKTRSNLENVSVMGSNGDLIPLSRLVRLEKGQSPQAINRVNGKNVVTINARVTGQDYAKVRTEIDARIAGFDLPPGYSVDLGDELEELNVNMANFAMSLVLSIILIYIVMGALFESYLLPLSILTCVPLAFVGVYWSMYITGTSMDTVSYIGCILMIGVVVNNGILIVDHINQLRKRGLSRHDAILTGGHDRLRPVMMTALTTILGCVPLAVGGAVGGEVSFQSLGRALIGGMTTGTFLTLMVVPLFYTLIDDAHIWFMRYIADMKALFGIHAATEDAEPDSHSELN
ncbi:MAG: efflux RND transporter permease subunit [FCB group bacterium]|jgi:HAE1 family hydrophobic/amphiphilic exporter-1|nr:efflux RND transporter permease subunit [FCB group bacterium]